MKYLPPKSQTETGSVLLVSLVITAVLGLTLASYLVMAQQQNVSVMRSQTWNSAIVMSEAGVEDALSLLNKFNSNFEKLTNWSASASIYDDSWTYLGANTYHVRRNLADGYYEAFITNNVFNRPVINSLGYVPWYYKGGIVLKSPYASAGVTEEAQGPTMTGRGVCVNTRIDALINVAMAALEQIDFNGKNVQTDSFDSSNPAFSDNGGYPAAYPERQRDQGDVVTDLAIIDSLNAGNAKIKGSAKTGPKGTLAIGPLGSVGDKAWVEGGSTGVQPGHFADDMNVLFPPVQLPSTTWYAVPNYPSGVTKTDVYRDASGTLVTNTGDYSWVIDGGGDYYISDLSKSLHVTGNACLLVTTKIALNGSTDRITIAPNSSLKLYMYGSTATISGLGVVNCTANANSFYYFGLPSNTKLTFGGNASFTGVVYAPQAAFTLGGGGFDQYDFIGSSVTRSVKMNGHYRFHFDEALRNNGMGRGYIPTSWTEM